MTSFTNSPIGELQNTLRNIW